MRNKISKMCVLLTALLFLPVAASSMPMFARKYGKNCNMCHSQVPQLNKTGYEFRLAGYRLPDEIGQKEDEFNMGDFFSARLQGSFTYKDHNDAVPASDSTNNQLEFKEATLYPLTGSWGKYFGSLVELSMAPDDVFEVENAYVRGVYGNEDGFVWGKLGIMHAFEGWGGSDRPVSLSRPLFQTQRATGSPFKIWSLDEMALELGYYFAKTGTTITGRIGNGIIWKEDGSGKGEPAQGGALTKVSGLGHKDKSYQFFLNQILNKESGVSVYYYRTKIPFPDPSTAPAVSTKDTLQRLAVYGNWYVLSKKLNILGGYEWGDDNLKDSTVAGAATLGENSGYYIQGDYHFKKDYLTLGVRYDQFDPSDSVAHNDQTAITGFVNYHPLHLRNLQVIGEFQHKTTDLTTGGHNEDNVLQLRGIFIF